MSKTQRNIKRPNRSRKGRLTTDAVSILENLIKDDPKAMEFLERATINARVAKIIYEARERAGLTQRQLAELVGTKQPVIARLEDSDYAGHSLTMLQRIATALDRSVEIRFTPPRENRRAA